MELENKPDGGEKEKETLEQKPAMTYAEFKARKGRKRGKNRGAGMNKDLAVKIAAVCGGVVVLVGAVGGGLYWHESLKYQTCFLPGTIVDGMDVTGKTASEVEDAITEQLKGYTLTINGREELSESITGESVGLYAEFDDTLEKAVAAQKPMNWGKYRFGKAVNEVNTDALLHYSSEMLDEAVAGLSCMDRENMREPQDARISDYDSVTGSYTIIKEDEGTELLEDKVKEAVATAIMSLAESVDLEERGCYLAPSVTSEDEALKTACETMNKYVGAKITYKFGDKAETLNGNEIHNWLTVNGTSVSVSEAKAAEYVKNLASAYNTAYKPKTLKTSYGKNVTITTGSYGWKIDQTKETAALVSLIKNGEQTSREPEYSQKAASRSGNDYGNTYVEINLTAQHLYFYVDGKLLVQSDFVSGNAAKGWSTPAGAYALTYKQRNATLKGQGYATPVSYWMPFNGGIGLHDANWRKTFGGTIYKNKGSHGCINLPPAVAKTIYENISAGDPVLCYHMDGTESSSTSGTKKDGEAETTAPATTAPTTAATTTAAPTTAAPTTAAPETTAAGPSVPETAAAETTPAVTAGGDKESFGPGFLQEPEGTTEQEIGPGF
nr:MULTISPECIES: peptidoglycan binding domain-containing protein [unclassified Clostridium]